MADGLTCGIEDATPIVHADVEDPYVEKAEENLLKGCEDQALAASVAALRALREAGGDKIAEEHLERRVKYLSSKSSMHRRDERILVRS